MKMNIHVVNPLFLVIALLSLLFQCQEVKYRLYNTTHCHTDTLTATTDTSQWSWKQGRHMSTVFLWAAGPLLNLTRGLLCPPWHHAVQVYLGSPTCSTQGNKAKAMLSTCRPRLFSAQSCHTSSKGWQISSARHKLTWQIMEELTTNTRLSWLV